MDKIDILLSSDKNRLKKFLHRLLNQRYLWLLLLPGLIHLIIFKYIPIYGVLIAFKDFDFMDGIAGIWSAPWIGLKYFEKFFRNPFAWRVIRNTIILSFYNMIVGFLVPVTFALMLNELKNKTYKKVVQTISYLPHFISVVVIVGIMKQICSPGTGIINQLLAALDMEKINFFAEKKWFRTLYIIQVTWQEFGWNTIIYLSSLTGIDPQLYESAEIDGAGRFKKMWHITLPGLAPTIIVLSIIRIGHMLNLGLDRILLMYSPVTYETSDVIQTFVYRYGLEGGEYGFGTAVSLFSSVITLVLVIITNQISKKVSETSLW